MQIQKFCIKCAHYFYCRADIKPKKYYNYEHLKSVT